MITTSFIVIRPGSSGEESDAEVAIFFLQDHKNPVRYQDIRVLKSGASSKDHDQIDHESPRQPSAYRQDHF